MLLAFDESKNKTSLLGQTSGTYRGPNVRKKHFSGYIKLPFIDSDTHLNTTVFTDEVNFHYFRFNDHFPLISNFNSVYVNERAIVSEQYGTQSKLNASTEV